MIAYQKKFLRIAEYWGAEPAGNPQVDLVRFFQHSEPLADAFCREFYSIEVDLQQPETDLFSKMKRNTRYEIRRAQENDQFLYKIGDGNGTPILMNLSTTMIGLPHSRGKQRLTVCGCRPWPPRGC